MRTPGTPWEAPWPERARLAEADLVQATLDRILDAAGRVFARSGITDARMPRIAEEAGVSKPTLYRYVSGKQSLVQLYFIREWRRLFDEVLSLRWRADLDADTLATILVELHFASRRHPVIAKLLQDEWSLVALFVTRAMAEESANVALDIGSWLFETAGVANPRFSAEVNMRILATLLVAPPFTVADTPEGIRRFLFLPVP